MSIVRAPAIESVDWTSLDTPFGPRTGGEIPPLLDKLDAPDARVRARALQDLHRRLVAVGGGYGTPFLDAALAAVPLIGARLDDPGVLAPQLGQVLAILGDVAAGNHRLHLSYGLSSAKLDRDDIGPVHAVQAAIAELAEARLDLLDVDEPATRAGVAFACAWLPGIAMRTRPALLHRLSLESNAIVRATLLLALGYVGGAADEVRAFRSEPAPVGVCGALAAMLCDPQRLEDELELALAPACKAVVKGLPFADGAVLGLRARVLLGAAVRRGDLERHPALIERLPVELRPEAEAATVLVAARAAETTALDPLDPADLSERARAVLREHAAALRTRSNPQLYDAFWRAGLFRYGDANERALGVDPSGPLDARSHGRPLWWWLHGARSDRVPFERWLAVLDGVDALAVLEDAACAPFELYRDRFRSEGYDIEPLITTLERSAAALAIRSATLDERLAKLRGYAADPKVAHGKGRRPWP